MPPKPPPPGVYTPAVTFFSPSTGLIDSAAQSTYFAYLSRCVTGIVVLGSNAEAMLLTRSERAHLVALARAAVPPGYPLLVGISGHSVVQTIEYAGDALAAGADYGLLLPAAYYGAATSKEVVAAFYDDVARGTELPLVVYNFPGVCNGVDLDSGSIAALAKRWPGRIVGVKLTCGSVAKITRLTAELDASSFTTFGGQSDFLVGGLAVGSQGCVAAFSNVFPKTVMRVYELWTEGKTEEALALQRKAALAESPVKAGIASTKYAVSRFSAVAAGIEDAEDKLRPRRPYLPVGDEVKANVNKVMAEVAEIEKSL